MHTILLVDNGSTRPGATQSLRNIAQQLSAKTGHKIHPVSLQHADRIPEELIDNIPANTLYNFLDDNLTKGLRQYVVLPLFFGLSKAITSFIPDTVLQLQDKHGEFSISVTDPVYPLPAGEVRLIDILYEYSQTTLPSYTDDTHYVLVDHGSPMPQVTRVREHIMNELQSRLPRQALLEQAVMERRKGKEYDFNGQLLEDWLKRKAQSGIKSVVVLLMFFLPGRHAGAGGDIEQICARVSAEHPSLSISISPLVGEHSNLIELLASRLHTVPGS